MCDHTNKNIYLPYLATVAEVIDETPDVRTLKPSASRPHRPGPGTSNAASGLWER